MKGLIKSAFSQSHREFCERRDYEKKNEHIVVDGFVKLRDNEYKTCKVGFDQETGKVTSFEITDYTHHENHCFKIHLDKALGYFRALVHEVCNVEDIDYSSFPTFYYMDDIFKSYLHKNTYINDDRKVRMIPPSFQKKQVTEVKKIKPAVKSDNASNSDASSISDASSNTSIKSESSNETTKETQFSSDTEFSIETQAPTPIVKAPAEKTPVAGLIECFITLGIMMASFFDIIGTTIIITYHLAVPIFKLSLTFMRIIILGIMILLDMIKDCLDAVNSMCGFECFTGPQFEGRFYVQVKEEEKKRSITVNPNDEVKKIETQN